MKEEKACLLCEDVKLTIFRESAEGGGEQLRIILQYDPTLAWVELSYPLTQNEFGLVSQYSIREALVIAMRRIVDEAIKEKVIRLSKK